MYNRAKYELLTTHGVLTMTNVTITSSLASQKYAKGKW